MEHFRSEGDFWGYYKRFNALCGGDWSGWKLTQARSKLEDMFGLRIAAGEMYFRKQASYDNLRLSLASMEKILLIVMVQNRGLNELAESVLLNVDAGARREGIPVLIPAVCQKPG